MKVLLLSCILLMQGCLWQSVTEDELGTIIDYCKDKGGVKLISSRPLGDVTFYCNAHKAESAPWSFSRIIRNQNRSLYKGKIK